VHLNYKLRYIRYILDILDILVRCIRKQFIYKYILLNILLLNLIFTIKCNYNIKKRFNLYLRKWVKMISSRSNQNVCFFKLIIKINNN